jgi:Ca2+/Na+ antiporter
MEKVNQYFYLMIAGFVALMFAITSKLTFAIKCVVAIFVIIYEGFIIYKYLHHRKVKRFEDNNIIWPPKEFVNSGINECPDYWVKDDTYKSATAGNVRCVNVFNIPTIDQSSTCYSVLDSDATPTLMRDQDYEDVETGDTDTNSVGGTATYTADTAKLKNNENKYLEGDKYYNKKYNDFTKTNKRKWIDSCGASERGKAAWIGY